MCNSVNLGFVNRDLNAICIAMENRNYGEAEKLLQVLSENVKHYHLEFVEINYQKIAVHNNSLKSELSKEYERQLEDHRQKLWDCFESKVEQEVKNRLTAMGGGRLRETGPEACH